MAFECVHCGTTIEDEALKIPRSGAACPACKKDPTEGWSPYQPDVAAAGRKVAEDINLRLLVQDFGVQEAALYFLEDIVLEKRHLLSLRLGRNPVAKQKCAVCGIDVPMGTGFRLELYDRWRDTFIIIGLCERHTNEGLWGQDLDLHANHPDPYLTRGDWHYATDGRERGSGSEPPAASTT